ncbi:U-box domain-containing protein 1-like [Magnolia sinica]|uniref:U-box domain-containing protein 1-like n=1 Tax=Magnolia sinica TaxID=86752 RepID=UPI002659E9DD|nr:U-box domain-containing protein 1-like [Magnolia sinica]
MQTPNHETITGYLAQVRSDSHEVQNKALKTLSYLTKVSPQNRNLVAQTDGAIPVFLSLSKSTSATAQILALSVLFNLSLNPNLRQTLATLETTHHLNSIVLAPSSPESGRLAASLICSLAMLDKNKAQFGVAGTVQVLVKALATVPARSSASHHLVSSLAELVQFQGNCTLAVRAGAVSVLFQVVESADGEDLAGMSLAILGLLARFEEGLEAIRGRNEVVGLLVDVLKRRCMLSKEGSADILLRLFEESEDCVWEAARQPEFSSLVADLSVWGSAKAREKATMLMRKMMEVNLDCYVEGNPMVLQW